jgi:hypothetical protein
MIGTSGPVAKGVPRKVTCPCVNEESQEHDTTELRAVTCRPRLDEGYAERASSEKQKERL